MAWWMDVHAINHDWRSGFSGGRVEPTIQWRFWNINFVGLLACASPWPNKMRSKQSIPIFPSSFT
jgi:hypothetical protein